VPPPAPEPDPLAPPLVPVSEPPESVRFPLEGSPGVLSGGVVGALVAPDWLPVASAPSPDPANVAADATDNNPANNNEVILLFIRVRLQKKSRYLMLV
jgi:hypothetical protein